MLTLLLDLPGYQDWRQALQKTDEQFFEDDSSILMNLDSLIINFAPVVHEKGYYADIILDPITKQPVAHIQRCMVCNAFLPKQIPILDHRLYVHTGCQHDCNRVHGHTTMQLFGKCAYEFALDNDMANIRYREKGLGIKRRKKGWKKRLFKKTR